MCSLLKSDVFQIDYLKQEDWYMYYASSLSTNKQVHDKVANIQADG